MSGTLDISFDADIDAARKYLKKYQRAAIPAATARALNRVGGPTLTEAKKRIRNVTTLDKDTVNKYMTATKATRARLIFRIRAKRRSPNLLRFMTAAQISRVLAARKLSNLKRSGKTYMTAKSLARPQSFYRGFIGKVSTGNPDAPSGVRDVALHRLRGVYHTPTKGRHAGKRREKLDTLKGPSVPKTFSRPAIIEHLRRRIYTRWQVEFNQQLKYYVDRLG